MGCRANFFARWISTAFSWLQFCALHQGFDLERNNGSILNALWTYAISSDTWRTLLPWALSALRDGVYAHNSSQFSPFRLSFNPETKLTINSILTPPTNTNPAATTEHTEQSNITNQLTAKMSTETIKLQQEKNKQWPTCISLYTKFAVVDLAYYCLTPKCRETRALNCIASSKAPSSLLN